VGRLRLLRLFDFLVVVCSEVLHFLTSITDGDETDGTGEGGVNMEMIDLLARTGAKRCENQTEGNSSAILCEGAEAEHASDYQRLFDKQLSSMPPEVMRHCYVELLRRSESLLAFMLYNVGDNQDWPIIFKGESKETVETLQEKVAELRDAVGCLTEV